MPCSVLLPCSDKYFHVTCPAHGSIHSLSDRFHKNASASSLDLECTQEGKACILLSDGRIYMQLSFVHMYGALAKLDSPLHVLELAPYSVDDLGDLRKQLVQAFYCTHRSTGQVENGSDC